MKVGQKLGGYEIIDIIESSREGVTYKVRNSLVQRFEALRVMPKALQDDPEKANRFLREAKIHSQMSHPNIVTFYHAVQLEGQLVITTELVEGTTLGARLETGPLPLDHALHIASEVLAALSHAHSLGIVHRDVTPASIILTSNGQVKLGAFSLAKTTTDPMLTTPGTVLGSLDYISPEQIMGRTDLDWRSDIYSLGVVLYEIVAGRRPFHEKSQFEIMAAHVNLLPPAPGVVNPSLPAELSEIVLKAMAKDPAARFQNAEEFRIRLDRLRGMGAPPPMPQPTVAPPQSFTPHMGAAQAIPAGAMAAQRTAAFPNTWALVAAGICTFFVVMLVFFAIVRQI